MAGSSRSLDQYYEKTARIQQSMHEREKHRLELERELFACSRSDKRISQIKCSKLHGYLKEITDREARAKMRNLKLQRDVECIEISMKEYGLDHDSLQQQKADFLKKISKFVEAKQKMKPKLEAKGNAVHRQQRHSNISQPAQAFTQSPADIFMDQQIPRASDSEAGTTRVHSHQALLHSPSCSVRSRERLPSGLLKNFRVGGEDAASKRTHLSDDISGSNDSPDDCNLSDKHERTMGLLPSVRSLAGAAGSVAFGSDDEQEASPLVTLTGSEKNPSPGNSNPTRAKNSPAKQNDSQEVSREPFIMGDEDRGFGHLMSETTLGKEAQETSGKCDSVSASSSDVQLSDSSSSDLTISVTQSEPEDDLPADDKSERNATYESSEDHKWHNPAASLDSNASKNSPRLGSDASQPVVTLQSLSLEGLFNLLDSIEGRLGGEQTHVYTDSLIDGRQLNGIISLCDDGAGLNDEDLEACGSVVLHELQRLSWSTEKGCLLPQDLVSAHQSSTEPNQISTRLPPNSARLWDRWFKHVLVLKEHRVLSTEHLVQLFTPLLLERHATYSQQAKVLLRTLLSRCSEECPSAEDESDLSSLCGPSLLADRDVKLARVVPKQRMQELQSPEEDSQDESPVESGPIRESKAYQLLKQSAMQKRLQSSEEEESDSSGINHGHEEDLGRAKRSSHQDPYPRRGNSEVLQSKALWKDTDDSDSEIEAALRPPTFSTNSDAIDDFYD
ncbi:centrosomal protein kizuna isoform X1 [Cololabis saira]|uniref:centrosomal protein kizuna isoform X1 n=2 Tax=Cololabis saira TaxID=129043 RepID=UPI002AD32FCC|nr:centrosomal protein kizuna isoform X1 [Cololabis saira]